MSKQNGLVQHYFFLKEKRSAGFSKVEILIFVGVIGLLGAVSIFLLNNSQQKTRDAQRLSDVRQIQAGLEMYYTGGASFSGACLDEIERNNIKTTSCQNNRYLDWQMYQDPSNASRLACSSETPDDECECTYGIEITNKDEYYVYFCLEEGTDKLDKGLHFVSRNGLDR